jgi:DnaA family protein
MIAASQLLLNIKLPDGATFDSFVGDQGVLEVLQQQLRCDDPNLWYIYLWGKSGSGCSHLLQAACHEGRSKDLACVFVSLSQPGTVSPELLDGLENQDLICLDDLGCILGNSQWEEAIFHLFNRARMSGTRLLVGSSRPPGELELGLADLKSRLTSGLVYHLQELGDEQKLTALRLRAANRGMNLEPEVARFILTRLDRGIDQLFAALDQLDQASLHQQRKLTINFAKEVLGI